MRDFQRVMENMAKFAGQLALVLRLQYEFRQLIRLHVTAEQSLLQRRESFVTSFVHSICPERDTPTESVGAGGRDFGQLPSSAAAGDLTCPFFSSV